MINRNSSYGVKELGFLLPEFGQEFDLEIEYISKKKFLLIRI